MWCDDVIDDEQSNSSDLVNQLTKGGAKEEELNWTSTDSSQALSLLLLPKNPLLQGPPLLSSWPLREKESLLLLKVLLKDKVINIPNIPNITISTNILCQR